MSSSNWYHFNLFSASEQTEDSVEFSLMQYDESLLPEQETINNMSQTYEQEEESYEFSLQHYEDTLETITEDVINTASTSEQEENCIEFFVEQHKDSINSGSTKEEEIHKPSHHDNHFETEQLSKYFTIPSTSSYEQDKDPILSTSLHKDFNKQTDVPKKLIGFSGHSQQPSQKHPSVPHMTNISKSEPCKALIDFYGPSCIFLTQEKLLLRSNLIQNTHQQLSIRR